MSERPSEESLAALRQEYGDAGLEADGLAPDPVSMFRRWFDQARSSGLQVFLSLVFSIL